MDHRVGAAGIRGTTFKLVFKPTGTGQAFALFSLSTVEGNVHLEQPGAPGPQPGAPQTPQGVAVTNGQEVVVTVEVQVTSSGEVKITAPTTITSTQPISVETRAALTQQAEALVTTAAATTFTPTTNNANSGNSGDTTKEEINSALKAAAEGPMKGVLAYTDQPLVSTDFNHQPPSSTVDSLETAVLEGKLGRVVSWYDNEWGFSNRMIDTAGVMAKFL